MGVTRLLSVGESDMEEYLRVLNTERTLKQGREAMEMNNFVTELLVAF